MLKKCLFVLGTSISLSLVFVFLIHLPLSSLGKYLFDLSLNYTDPNYAFYYGCFEVLSLLGWAITAFLTPFILVRTSCRMACNSLLISRFASLQYLLVYAMLEIPYVIFDRISINVNNSIMKFTDDLSYGISDMIFFINIIISSAIICLLLVKRKHKRMAETE